MHQFLANISNICLCDPYKVTLPQKLLLLQSKEYSPEIKLSVMLLASTNVSKDTVRIITENSEQPVGGVCCLTKLNKGIGNNSLNCIFLSRGRCVSGFH